MAYRFLRLLYNVTFTCLLPVIFFRLWLRSLKLPAYRKRWSERLANLPFQPLNNVIWLHAVSVGEAVSSVPLIHSLLEQHPDIPILVTTTTPTGSERVQVAFKDDLGKRIFHCYMPYDLPWVMNKFINWVKPKLVVLMETELWPNLLRCCEQKNIPVMIANGRLSPTSIKNYKLLGSAMHKIVQPITTVAAQSAMDAQRFASLGVSQDKINADGNIKFDLELPGYLTDAGKQLRGILAKKLIWIAASTHDGEEEIMLKAYQELKADYPELLLLLVPRHPDRFNQVADLCKDYRLKIVRRSDKQACNADTDVFLGDTMGELPVFYAASDVAFVGGSLVPIGGHNLLEPAAVGLPILTGPHLFNFISISELLFNANGATLVKDQASLVAALRRLFDDQELITFQGQQAKAVVAQNKGALARVVQHISNALVAA